ncbi:MAG: replication-relaxation family protein [Acidobacteriia bacterium]|nr:replication-relaxation family protein [Terriglobia bacterium]
MALTRAGLFRRFFLGTGGGGKKALYAVSEKGARLAGVPYRGPRRRQNETLVAAFFVQHQFAVNQIYCAVKYQTIPVPGVVFRRCPSRITWIASSCSFRTLAIRPWNCSI